MLQGEGQDVGVGKVEHGDLRGWGIRDRGKGKGVRGMVSQDGGIWVVMDGMWQMADGG